MTTAGQQPTAKESIGGMIFLQAICVMLNLLRLFEFKFAGCSTSSCRKMAGNNVFSGLLAAMSFTLAGLISGPCEAFTYQSGGKSVAWKMTETFLFLSLKGVSFAWQAYDSAGQTNDISKSDDELVWLYILGGFAASGVTESMSISLDLAAKWKGCHTFFYSPMDHNFLFRIFRVCLQPVYNAFGIGIIDSQAKWLTTYAAAQDEMRMNGESLPSHLDLKNSVILSTCGWQGGDAHPLFDRLKKDTNKEGTWIAGGKNTSGPSGRSLYLV